MRFIASSTALLSHLQAISRVISNKNTLPILDSFLFHIEGSLLTITASDLETTLITSLELDSVDGEDTFAVTAKILMDILKEFPEQPLTFELEDNMNLILKSENGQYNLVAQDGSEYPKTPVISDVEKGSFGISVAELERGINKTIFATADDELRPVMNGIYFDLTTEGMTLVGSDAHKLVRFKNTSVKLESDNSFILPKKPAMLLKNILPKESGEASVEFDKKNACFSLANYKMYCRLVEGRYPSYNSVIPLNNPNKIIISRTGLITILKRVSVCSNQASNLIKLDLKENEVMISAQDIDFSISAKETLPCQYQGEPLNIGFKSVFLVEILANLNSNDVIIELADSSRAGVILPFENEANEEVLMLLMPMMLSE